MNSEQLAVSSGRCALKIKHFGFPPLPARRVGFRVGAEEDNEQLSMNNYQ
ncbi:MAG: hypothetical protein WBN39_06120 [Flavobacteriaceae bacterium]